jgi:flagellar L-ring protein precursor FlgH
MGKREKQLNKLTGVGLMTLLLSSQLLSNLSFGESLFRASASYSNDTDFTPRSLYTQPKPQNVGDIITILIDETNKEQVDSNLKVSRSQKITDSGTGLTNNFVKFFLGKIPGVQGQNIKDPLFSFDGMDDKNTLSSTVSTTKTTKFNDSITCQVVQVLPNGNLMVQGKKTTMMNKERQDLYVSGIVNPFYLDKDNQIKSKQVANMQFLIGGKGVVSRQQNDGIANKIYQFFH